MLFDLRGRGRRNTIKVVYIMLAFLMGGGLVLFGIGGNTSGGLVDAITGSSGADTGADRFKQQITEARTALKANPRDETAYVKLIRAQVGLAGTGDQFNSATNEYDKAGQADLLDATRSWESYQKLNPTNKNEEGSVAARIVQAYAALGDLPKLVEAQEVVALNRDAVGPYAALAQYAYAAGQTRKGDLASQKALSLADPSERAQLKGDLDQYKQSGLAAAGQSATPGPSTSVPVEPTPKPPDGGKPKPKRGAASKPEAGAKKGPKSSPDKGGKAKPKG